MSLLGILNTGRLGLVANQTALAVTGNNIANVNTPGYSRQRTEMQTIRTGGVSVSHIERMRDEFLASRMRDATTRLGGSNILADNLSAIEGLMAESDESDINKTVRDFFSTMQNLTLKPGGLNERDMLRSRGRELAANLGGLAGELRQVREQLDNQLAQSLERVNTITGELAELNQRMTEAGTASGTAQQMDTNTMLDRRDALLEELSTFMPLHVIKNERGQVTVFGGGEVLVEGISARKLTTVVDPANDGYGAIAIQDENGRTRALTGKFTEGSLGALIEARDTQAGQALADVERLAATLIRAVNVQHRAGTGLDGVSGRDFFSGLAASATASRQNTGGATVTAATITDDTQLTFDDYELRFTGPGQFDVINTTTGTTVSSGNAYTSGAAIDVAGMRVVLSDATGTPAAGDAFRINSYANTTARMSLAPAVAADARAIAAGQSAASGDNRNALALAALLDAPVMGGAGALRTFEDFFNQARLRIATATQQAESARMDDEITQSQIQAMSDAASGVSVDEEATQIIQFQRAFEASSRVVRVTDELMQTILGMMQ